MTALDVLYAAFWFGLGYWVGRGPLPRFVDLWRHVQRR